MMTNAISHPQARANRGIVAGAASAPTDAPLLKIEVEKARSFLGSTGSTLMAAGKLPASPTARIIRHERNNHTEMVAIYHSGIATSLHHAQRLDAVVTLDIHSYPSAACMHHSTCAPYKDGDEITFLVPIQSMNLPENRLAMA